MAKEATPTIMLSFVITVVVPPPTILTTLSALFGLVHRGGQRLLHLTILFCLGLLTLSPMLSALGIPGRAAVLVSAWPSASFLLGYSKSPPMRSFVSALSTLIIVAPVLLLTNNEIRNLLTSVSATSLRCASLSKSHCTIDQTKVRIGLWKVPERCLLMHIPLLRVQSERP